MFVFYPSYHLFQPNKVKTGKDPLRALKSNEILITFVECWEGGSCACGARLWS